MVGNNFNASGEADFYNKEHDAPSVDPAKHVVAIDVYSRAFAAVYRFDPNETGNMDAVLERVSWVINAADSKSPIRTLEISKDDILNATQAINLENLNRKLTAECAEQKYAFVEDRGAHM